MFFKGCGFKSWSCQAVIFHSKVHDITIHVIWGNMNNRVGWVTVHGRWLSITAQASFHCPFQWWGIAVQSATVLLSTWSGGSNQIIMSGEHNKRSVIKVETLFHVKKGVEVQFLSYSSMGARPFPPSQYFYQRRSRSDTTSASFKMREFPSRVVAKRIIMR